MSYGQFTEGTRHHYPETPQPGRRTTPEILRWAQPKGWVKAWRSAHNEITRAYATEADGGYRKVVRLIETDIVSVRFGPDSTATIHIDNGHWYGPTTCRHIVNAMARQGWPVNVWNSSKRTGVVRMRLVWPGQCDVFFFGTLTITLDNLFSPDGPRVRTARRDGGSLPIPLFPETTP